MFSWVLAELKLHFSSSPAEVPQLRGYRLFWSGRRVCYAKIFISLWVTEKRLEQLSTLRLQGCIKKWRLQPLLLFMQNVMDLLQKSSKESWIRVFYILDNFVTCICTTEKSQKEPWNRWSNFELYCQHVLICCTKKPQQRHQKEEPKMWSRMSAENASRSTFWLQCHK